MLARLGVGHLLVVDPDVIELSNLPRVLLATAEDAARGTLKVDVATRHSAGLPYPVRIEPVPGDVRDHAVALQLRSCDVVMSCVDRHYPRAQRVGRSRAGISRAPRS